MPSRAYPRGSLLQPKQSLNFSSQVIRSTCGKGIALSSDISSSSASARRHSIVIRPLYKIGIFSFKWHWEQTKNPDRVECRTREARRHRSHRPEVSLLLEKEMFLKRPTSNRSFGLRSCCGKSCSNEAASGMGLLAQSVTSSFSCYKNVHL